tara:strand:+ start:1529 stop:1714 length:186 start_codon:yes stop_codon:yes gene_type:complete
MTVGVENSNTEHKKVEAQRAKSKLGKAFAGFLISHSKVARQQAEARARRRPVAKIKKNKKK